MLTVWKLCDIIELKLFTKIVNLIRIVLALLEMKKLVSQNCILLLSIAHCFTANTQLIAYYIHIIFIYIYIYTYTNIVFMYIQTYVCIVKHLQQQVVKYANALFIAKYKSKFHICTIIFALLLLFVFIFFFWLINFTTGNLWRRH